MKFKFTVCYLLICGSMLLCAEIFPVNLLRNFYRYDREGIFWILYYSSLAIIGLALGEGRLGSLRKTVVLGLVSGAASGLIALAVICVRNGPAVTDMAGTGELLGSLMYGSLVFITPLWGLIAFVFCKLVLSKIFTRKLHA